MAAYPFLLAPPGDVCVDLPPGDTIELGTAFAKRAPAFLTRMAKKNGIKTRSGMLTAMKSAWYGASATARVAPATLPTDSARKKPAHVGQAVKSPTAAPQATIHLPVTFATVLRTEKSAIERFRPTRGGTTKSSRRLSGTNCSARCAGTRYRTSLGRVPTSPQQGDELHPATVVTPYCAEKSTPGWKTNMLDAIA